MSDLRDWLREHWKAGNGTMPDDLAKSRGFRMDRVLLVPHGGARNDTIVTVETKIQGRLL